jgi:CRP/FNR family cyclic AMP-dependent transcriptional regulator
MDPARLKSVPLFESLSGREREQVARWADEVEVKEGKHIVDQGHCAYEFFVIEDGTADVIRAGERLTELGPGDFFGELALLQTDRRTASVVATSPMRLIVMMSRDFKTMDRDIPHVAARVREAIERRK